MANLNIAIKIAAQDNASGPLGRVNAALGNLGGVARSGFGVLQGIGTAAMAGAAAGAAVLAGGFLMAGRSAIEMNSMLETSTLQFETLMGDADRAEAHVASLFEFAKNTPFETQPIIDASRVLQTFGGDALNTMDNLTLMGDAAAATNAPIEDVAFWTGRMYAALQAGNPIGEAVQNLSQLAVISPQAALEMERLMESGASADEVFAAFQEDLGRFGGAMEKQAGTWQGLMSTIKDTVNITLATALKPFFDIAKSGLESLATFLSGDTITNGVQLIADTLAGATTAVGLFFDRIETGAPITDALQILVTQLGLVFGMTSEEARALGDRFSEIVTWVQGVITAAQPLIETVMGVITQLVSWQDVLAALGVAVAAVVLPALAGIVVAAAPVIAVAALLIGGIALLRNAWEQNWGGIQEKTQAVIDFVVPLITNAVTTIQAFWAENGDAILAKAAEIWTGVQSAISTAISTVQDIITTVYTAVSTFWAANGDTILAKATEIWTGIQTAVQTAISTVQSIVTTVSTAIQSFWTAHGETILAAARNTWEFIKNTVQNATDFISGLLTAFRAAREGDWTAFGEAIRTAWDASWEQIKNIVTTAKDNIILGINALIDTVKNIFTQTDWAALGQSIIDGLVSGLGDGTARIADKLTEIANAAMAAWDGFWGNASPSKLMIKSAGFITGGVMVGWERTVGGLLDMVAGSGNELADAFFAPVAARVGSMGQGGKTLPPANTQAITNNYYQLQANYRQQDERTLRDDVRLLQLMGAAI